MNHSKSKPKRLITAWIISSVLTYLVIYTALCSLRIKQEFDYAKHNEYASQHIWEEIAWIASNSINPPFYPVIFVCPIIFLLLLIIRKKRTKDAQAATYIPIIVLTPIITLVVTIILLIVTLPLWFHL